MVSATPNIATCTSFGSEPPCRPCAGIVRLTKPLSYGVNPVSARSPQHGLSLGIVQQLPTQFDEPFYRYLAKTAKLEFRVYYYGADETGTYEDPELGRSVAWTQSIERGYPAVFAREMGSIQFARLVVNSAHDLIVISGYNRPHALLTAIMARTKGLPAGLRIDNVLPAAGGRRRHWLLKKCVFPLLFRLYTTGHPVGRQAGQYLVEFGFAQDALFRFPYSVDHRWFARESANARANSEANRGSWGLPANGRVVCGVMKFSPREDPLTLVEAFHSARNMMPDLNLLLIGDGPLRSKVEQAAGAELGKRIFLPGYQKYDRLPSAYAASDLFVHTASGAWEVSVNEALCCGIPVITSDEVASAAELVIPRRFGSIFKRGDAKELAQYIVAALGDTKLLARVRNEGPESLEEWDYPATADRLISAVEYTRQSRSKRSRVSGHSRGPTLRPGKGSE